MPPRQAIPRTASRTMRLMVLAAALGTLLAAIAGPGATTALAGKRTYKLKRGLTLTTISKRRGPYKIRVLTVNNPAQNAPTVDVGTAGKDYPNTRKTSDIGTAYGALAAVNGDFGHDGRPFHVSAEDGDLRTSGLKTGVAFSTSADERRAFGKQPQTQVRADTSNPAVDHFGINVWNAGNSGGGRIAAYTPVGGSLEKPKSDNCTAKLLPAPGSAGNRAFGPDGDVVRTYVVEKQEDPCPFDPPAVGSEPGTVTIAAKRDSPKGNQIKALQPGDEVVLSWTVGFSRVLDVIGGQPQLLADPDGNGNPTVKAPKHCGSYFCNRNPRTGVGFNHACTVGHDGCKVFLVVVDGRQTNWSVGMDLVQFAKVFEHLGAVYAINMDGGGGATMWVSQRGKYCQTPKQNGCLVNRPSDGGGERSVTTSLMVLPGQDSGESLRPRRRAADTSGVLAPSTAADLASADLAMTDPGSTGGLLDAMVKGGLGRVPRFTPDLQQALQAYRARR